MAYRTVLVGTDGSETATLALRTATVLAKRYRSEVLIVCAHGDGLDDATAREVLRYARQDVRKEGLQTRTVMRQGDPSEVILGAADERGAELIVTGNVGMGKARRVRLGGVPDRIAHAAPCDTLIVHTSKRAAEHPDALGRYEKVLIATDGSATASEAARKGFELAEILGASVTLVHVGDPLIGAIVLDETAKGRPGTAEVRPRTVEGDPADQILRIAAEEEVDLVVVGNKGMAGPRRYLLAAVPNKVAHESPTDVLIAKTVGRSIGDIAAGHGALVDVQGRRVAVFKAEDGSLTALNPRCTHMGCTVDWNEAERTWDCPCHGSRYDLEGEVLRGPAKRPLERVELDRP